jgi:hypothetical protein
MSLAETPNQAPPLIGKDGKPIPGCFAFDSLPRNPQVEKEITVYISESELNKKLQELEASK